MRKTWKTLVLVCALAMGVGACGAEKVERPIVVGGEDVGDVGGGGSDAGADAAGPDEPDGGGDVGDGDADAGDDEADVDDVPDGGDEPDGGSNNGGGDPDGPKYCVPLCDEVADCGEGDWECTGGRCQWTSTVDHGQCDEDADCVPSLSGWQESCAGQDDCAITQACIDVDGAGLCAFAESEYIDCESMQMDAVARPLFGEAGQATVCERPAACHETGYCYIPCQSDADCAMYPAGSNTCLPSGVCGCSQDSECDAANGADTCYDGVCGCSGDAVCGEGKTCG